MTRVLVCLLLLLVAWSEAAEGQGVSYVVATSATADGGDLQRVDSVLGRMESQRRLRLVSRQGDRNLRGRVHEYYAQFHKNVPVVGSGLSRQRSGGRTVSILGALHPDVDIEVVPALTHEEAVARATETTGTGPVTKVPPALVVLPTLLGEYVLAWRVTMRDLHVWFIDASNGRVVRRENLLHEQSPTAAVGSGYGAAGQLEKLSVTATGLLLGEGFEARDQLRGAEIITLDMRGFPSTLFDLLEPDVFWEPSDVAIDVDNEWETRPVVATHANVGFVYDYLLQQLDWNAMDGQGGRVMAATNFSWANAIFAPPPFGPEGTGVVAFGQTDLATNKTGLFSTLDIVAHELMHGVTHFSVYGRSGEGLGARYTATPGPSSIVTQDGNTWACGDTIWFPQDGATLPLLCEDGRLLLVWEEAGAINEAYSDILGIAAEFALHPSGDDVLNAEVLKADYVMGEDEDIAVRNPGLPGPLVGGLSYPSEMRHGIRFVAAHVGGRYIRFTPLVVSQGRALDFGAGFSYDGIHWNSLILSHGFVLAVEGGRHASSGVSVDGVGRSNMQRIVRVFFRAMTDLIPPRATFEMVAAAVRQSATDLHGSSSPEYVAVDQALAAVGLPKS